jgi:RimJ/RimL family protein N-acetyltransferase
MRSEATSIITGRDVAVAEWVRLRIPDPVDDWGPCRAIGIVAGDELIAGVVYNNFRWPNIEASIASTTPAWCSRRNLAALFAFPFGQLQVRRMGALTAAPNVAVRAFLLRLGFRQEGVARQALRTAEGGVADAVIFGMLAAECRWFHAPGVIADSAGLVDVTPRAG